MKEKHNHLIGKEMPYSHAIQFISPIVFLIVWALDSFIFKWSIGLSEFVPWPIRVGVGIVIFGVSMALMRAAEQVLFHGEQKMEVITEGILSHVRHPLYLGGLLIYVGFIVSTFSIISAGLFILIVIAYNQLASYEEKDLTRIFGEQYTEYKNKVPKWIPSFKARIDDKQTIQEEKQEIA
jgi:protein-S-isoprenylcysteine O-methyltransferase Ste14